MDGVQVNANGNVLHSEIVGAIKMNTKLSGMPELRLGLNDRVQFDSAGRGNGMIARHMKMTCCGWVTYS